MSMALLAGTCPGSLVGSWFDACLTSAANRPKGQRHIERSGKLGKERDRSVNYLVVQAIMEYLDRNRPL